jgi:hypothetical protein
MVCVPEFDLVALSRYSKTNYPVPTRDVLSQRRLLTKTLPAAPALPQFADDYPGWLAILTGPLH